MDDIRYCEQGRVYCSSGLYEMAISQFTRAIAINPRCHDAYKHRGLIYCLYVKDLYDEALYDFSKAIELCPDDPVPYHGRGLVHYAKGLYDLALLDFSKVLELNPKWGISLYKTRGVLYLKCGRFEEAVSDFTQAIEFDPEHEESYRQRALAWYHLKRFDRALMDARSSLARGGQIDCIEIDPDFLKSLQNAVGENRENKSNRTATVSILAFPGPMSARKSVGGR